MLDYILGAILLIGIICIVCYLVKQVASGKSLSCGCGECDDKNCYKNKKNKPKKIE